MSYTRKLTQFTIGKQYSTCGEYLLEDLNDMFCQTAFSNNDDYYLEDVLTENERGRAYNAYTLTENVTVLEVLNDDEMDMFIELTDYGYDEYVQVECSAKLDNEFANESI